MLDTPSPPEDTRIRRAVSPLFAARRAEAHRSMIDALATTLVGRCASSGLADLVCDLAVPLAVGVLCQVVGLPSGDHGRFGGWVRQVHRIDGGSEAGRRIVEAIAAMDRYLEERAAEGPVPGVLAELVTRTRPSAPEPHEEGLTEDEVIALGRDLMVGGYESTANLISGGLALLLTEPSRYERVHGDPATIDAVVEECLRHVAPFPQPEAPLGHLSFGRGAHHCLGAVLARREAHAAFRAVVTGLDDVRLACSPEELVWEPGLTPTLRSLPVRFTPRQVSRDTES